MRPGASCVQTLCCPIFLHLRWSCLCADTTNYFWLKSLNLWTSVVLYIIYGTQKRSTWSFSFIPQGFSKTCVISCGPEIVSFSCKRRKKRDLNASCDCIKFILGSKNLCFFFSITPYFPCSRFIGNVRSCLLLCTKEMFLLLNRRFWSKYSVPL